MNPFRIKDENGNVAEFEFLVLSDDPSPGQVTVVVGDVPQNRGMSSTNCFEKIATMLFKAFVHGLGSPAAVKWIQRDSEGKWFWVDLNFMQNHDDVSFHTPVWTPIMRDELVDILRRVN